MFQMVSRLYYCIFIMKNQEVSAFLQPSTVCRCSHHYIITGWTLNRNIVLYNLFFILCIVVQFDFGSKIQNIPPLLYVSYKYAIVYSWWLYLSQAPALNSTGEHSSAWQDRERLILFIQSSTFGYLCHRAKQ